MVEKSWLKSRSKIEKLRAISTKKLRVKNEIRKITAAMSNFIRTKNKNSTASKN